MKWYAIQNKRNGKYISGTDCRRNKPRQILSDEDHPPMLFSASELMSEIKNRQINLKYYDIVAVQITE